MVDILDFIPYYPNIEDDDFNQKIYNKKEFNSLKTTLKEELVPGSNMKHQEFVSRFLSGYTLYDGLLLFHEMGTGKTCAAFATSEKILNENFGINKVIVIANNDKILTNLKNELILKCTTKYLDQIDNYDVISVNKKIRRTNAVLTQNFYNFYTAYNFCKEVEKLPGMEITKRFSNSIIIIDEVHNINIKNKHEDTKIKKYEIIHRVLHLLNNSKTLLLSGTPMYDRASEISDVMNLILPMEKQLETDKEFDNKYLNNEKLFKNDSVIKEFNDITKGRISYIKQEIDIQKNFITTSVGKSLMYFKIFNRIMNINDIQNITYVKKYQEEQDLIQSNEIDNTKFSLKSGTRQASLFVFPDGSTGQEGFKRWVEIKMGRNKKKIVQLSAEFITFGKSETFDKN